MIKVLELKGYASYRALCAYAKLVYGMKMIPAFLTLSLKQFEDDYLNGLPEADQLEHFKRGAEMVTLERDELDDLIYFVKDQHGVKYTKENIGNLGPIQIRDIVAAVAHEIFKIKVDSISTEQKKNLKTAQ